MYIYGVIQETGKSNGLSVFSLKHWVWSAVSWEPNTAITRAICKCTVCCGGNFLTTVAAEAQKCSVITSDVGRIVTENIHLSQKHRQHSLLSIFSLKLLVD